MQTVCMPWRRRRRQEVERGVQDVERCVVGTKLDADDRARVITTLLDAVQLAPSMENGTSARAARLLAMLLQESSDVQRQVVLAKGVPALVVCVAKHMSVTQEEELEEQESAICDALRALNMLRSVPASKAALSASTSIDVLVSAWRRCDAATKALVIPLLGYVLKASDSKVKKTISKTGGMPLLIAIAGGATIDGVVEAIKLLKTMMDANEDNTHKLATSGGVEALVAVLDHGTSDAKSVALGMLCSLASIEEFKRAIGVAGGAAPMVKLALCSDSKDVIIKVVAALEMLSHVEENCLDVVSSGGMDLLVDILKRGWIEAKKLASSTLCRLAAVDSLRHDIGASGCIPHLLDIAHDGDDESVAEALKALVNLSPLDENRRIIASSGGIAMLIQRLHHGTAEANKWAAATLWNLSRLNEMKRAIGDAGGIMQLIELVRTGDRGCVVKAIGALSTLSIMEANRLRIAACNGIPVLVAKLHHGHISAKRLAAFTLSNLAVQYELRRKIGDCGAIPKLVELLLSDNEESVVKALGALRNLSHDDDNDRRIACCGGIDVLLSIIKQEPGIARAKKDAASTLSNLGVLADVRRRVGASGAIPALIELIGTADNDTIVEAVSALSNLARSEDNCVRIAECGGIDVLISVVRRGTPKAKRFAASVLWDLATLDTLRSDIGEACGIEPLLYLAQTGDNDCVVEAVGALSHLAHSHDNCVRIAAADGVPALLKLMQQGIPAIKKGAACTLWSLSHGHDDLKRQLVQVGGIEEFIELAACKNDQRVTFAVEALRELSALEVEISDRILSTGGVDILMNVLKQGPRSARRDAFQTLEQLNARDASVDGRVRAALGADYVYVASTIDSKHVR